MHGGPPAALVGRVAEELTQPGEHVARVNVELERPVPLVPLRAFAERRDVSRRVAHIRATLSAADKVVVSATMLVLRVSPLPTPAWQPQVEAAPLLDESHRAAVPAWASGNVPTTYHQHGVEHRMPPDSSFTTPGPATSWVRLEQPLVAGEETTGLCRVLAAADFGSGISAIYGDEQQVGLINADLSVALSRRPEGEWIRVEATTVLDVSGSALSTSHLADQRGPLGIATQSLLGLRL